MLHIDVQQHRRYVIAMTCGALTPESIILLLPYIKVIIENHVKHHDDKDADVDIFKLFLMNIFPKYIKNETKVIIPYTPTLSSTNICI